MKLDGQSHLYTFKYMIMFFPNRLFSALAIIASLFAIPVLAEGDREYGEYLSSECVTCHRAGAADAKIPSIVGMDAGGFADIMKAYRSKQLDNPAMQTVAGRLTDEDIAALAAYFSSLEQAE